eukprot:Tbor_TRINITY_DN5210_c2_g1::TRINITY_DN5210_c2_g1_i2::g.16217::m.16217/K19750/DNAAF1, LRRC50, ODA7; dynein assembly factor 1, axonemal
MTRTKLKKICKDINLFTTPSLNDKLYLHFHGFQKIENLEEYNNCRVLWLENNCIETIENLEALKELDTLFLHHNVIRSFVCPISNIPTSMPLLSVKAVNLSHNFIDSLEHIATMFPNLEKLQIAHNRIRRIPLSLVQLKNLTVIDISHNNIGDSHDLNDDVITEVESDEQVKSNPKTNAELNNDLKVLVQIENLLSLLMHGNEITKNVPYYRRRVIGEIKSLKYLDEYPIFEDERRACDAFMLGGLEAERAERKRIQEEKEQERKMQAKYFSDLVERSRIRGVKMNEKERKKNTEYYELNNRQETTDNREEMVDKKDRESIHQTLQASLLAAATKSHTDREMEKATSNRHFDPEPDESTGNAETKIGENNIVILCDSDEDGGHGLEDE